MISNSMISKAMLVGIVAVFMVMLGHGISKKTRASVAPPVYDPISYYSKAGLVWKAIKNRSFQNVMNWSPYRPPGSSLILYPFGFHPSIKGFLFRSVLAPITIWSLALIILVLPLVRCRSSAIIGGGLIAGLISMPIFYQFQLTEIVIQAYRVVNQWGLVDGLLGAVAALAVALIYVGITRASFVLCLLGWLTGAYSLFIKPSGILVMGGLFGIAIVELFLRYCSEPRDRRTILKSGASILSGGLLIYGIALYLAFSTDYLGNGAVAKSILAQKIDISLSNGPLLPHLYLFIQPVIGWWWFLPLSVILIGLVIEAVHLLYQHRLPAAGLRLVGSAVIAGAAIWWWVNLAGMELRFLFPILLMLIAWLIPDIFMRLERLAPKAKKLAIVYCFIPCILLVGMLHSGQIDIRLQKVLGVNLTNDQYEDEVIQGKWLLSQSKLLQRPLHIYWMSDGLRLGVVEMTDLVDAVNRGNKPSRFITCRPNTWFSEPGLQVKELLKSDFLVMDRMKSGPNSASTSKISFWRDEAENFKQFAYSGCGADKNGLEVVFDDEVKILKVVDARKFSDSIYAWTKSIEWANDFSERNKDFLEGYK